MGDKIENEKENEQFCYAPWHSLYVDPSGPYRVCCNNWESIGSPSEGKTFEEIFNGGKAKEIRQTFLSGALPISCKSCFLNESNSFKSLRQYFSESLVSKPKQSEYDHSARKEDLQKLDLCLSNKCNLACEYCNSGTSTQWIKKEKQLKTVDQKFYENFWSQTPGVYHQDFENINQIFNFSNNLDHIEFKGGEPLLYKGHAELLRQLQSKAPSILLTYFTNGTVYNQEIVDLWQSFKHIDLYFSIDAVDPLFSYIRDGNYDLKEDVETNIFKYHKSHPSMGISIHNTISAYNILNIDEFVNWWLPLHEKFGFRLSLGIVNNPDIMSLRVLTPELKEIAIQKISNLKLNENNVYHRKIIELKETVRNTKFDPKLAKLFIYHTKQSEKEKEMDFLNLSPEFNHLWNELA